MLTTGSQLLIIWLKWQIASMIRDFIIYVGNSITKLVDIRLLQTPFSVS